MKKIIAFLFLLSTSASFAQTEVKTFFYDKAEAIPREHNIDIKHILIDVSFEPIKGIVKGNVTHTFTGLQNNIDSIFFDAPEIKINSATIDGRAARFVVSAKGVTVFPNTIIHWDSEHTVTFNYEAQPRLGLYFIGWNDPENKSRKQIWTQGQAYDNRYWFPLYDKQNDKVISEVKVTFNSEYKVLSNGEKLMEKLNKDGSKSWHYKMTKPHAPYLIMLGIGKYDIEKRKSKNGIPVNLWYYPEYPERVKPTYDHSTDMVDWLEEELGVKYPWTTYSQIPVQDYTFGAMENTTATLFGDFYLIDENASLDKPYLYVNAHELTHQWFGDDITERTETHHWLQESFATFYGNLYVGKVKGKDYYDWSRKIAIDQALEASKKDNNPVASSVGGTVRHYPKGAVVLDMLKYTVGEEGFKRAIKYYLEKHSYSNVDTEDLLIAFHEKLGLSLDWFWEEWLYRGGEPKYEVQYREIQADGKKACEFTITQIHETNQLIQFFKMPTIFEVHFKDGTSETKKEWIDKYKQTVTINNPLDKEVDYVLFDPNMQMMKASVFKKPYEMLASQALKGKNMLDRYEAVSALKNYPLEQKINLLDTLFSVEKFHGVKSEIIVQVASSINNSKAFNILKKAIHDPDAEVRKSVVTNLKVIPEGLLPDFETLLKDRSYVNVEQVLEKLCYQYPSNKKNYLELTKNIIGVRGNNVKVKWLEISFNDNEESKSQLVAMTGPSYEFLTRCAAITSLKKLNYMNESLIKNLFDAILNPNGKLSTEATAALKYFYGQLAFRGLIENNYNNNNFEKWQKEILSKVIL